MATNVTYCASINDGTTYIVLDDSKVSLNYDDKVSIVNIPTTYAQRGTTTPETKTLLIELGKLTKSFTINGNISHGMLPYSLGNNETHVLAKDKINALKTLKESLKTLTLIYDGTSYSGTITKMEFGTDSRDQNYAVNVSSTATSATATTLADTTQTWTVNDYAGYMVAITGGLGKGQIKTIVSNTSNTLTVGTWDTTPNNTSTYKIISPINHESVYCTITINFVVGVDKLAQSS